jgi:phage terminase large subunit-like protein
VADPAEAEPMPADAVEVGPIPPRLVTVGRGGPSYGPEVVRWAADHLGVELMPWQVEALTGMLEYDPTTGDLIRRRSLVSVARQNGKTTALKAFIGWTLTNEPIRRGAPVLTISTAHQLDLAVEIFEQLAPILEAKFGAKAYWSYGRNECVMADGKTRWLVQAATDRAFHGFSPTYVVADEIWGVSPNVIFNGALPAQRAQKSPLLSTWSTAGTEDSAAMLKIREEALRAIDKGEFTKLYFAEWSVPPGVDEMDPQYWPMANPAIGYTLDPSILADEAQQSDRAAFMRASLNLWISSANSWLNPGVFDELIVPSIPPGGVIAVDNPVDESMYYAVRATVLDGGRIGVTVEFTADTMAAMWDQLAEAAKTCQTVALTPSLDALAPPAFDRKKTTVGYAELVTHTATIRQLINEGKLVHTGETMLSEHVNRAVGVRTQGGYALSSQRSPGPITLARCMVFAAALAARPGVKAKPSIAFGR